MRALCISLTALRPACAPLQVVDMGEAGPIRCGRCKAYMNPYVRWASNGKSYTCNFCGCSNQTPDNYFCHIGPDGRRRDAGGQLQQLLPLPAAAPPALLTCAVQ
jgi:protein transport protein SEC24